ncbi:MAG: 3-dehydroquinate synthase family protein [Planctomycetota bacterium]|jgi:3-dehydroquinate synthase
MANAGAEPGGSTLEERVDLPGRTTRIVIGEGVRARLWSTLRTSFPHAERIGLVADRTVDGLWPLEPPRDAPDVIRHLAPPGEAAKTRETLSEIQDALLDLRRSEPVVALGGGALLDVAGFAAATVRRGLPWVAMPTTVVGMADAAVGGKVAVNHARGKNLLGTFHPPQLVLSDVETLSSLDARDRVAGLAEIYKAGQIGDPSLLRALEAGPPEDPSAWVSVLARSVAVKARLVEADERDHGARRALNYGHTVGHALETLLGNERLRHGEAIAIGMLVAARIACARRLVPEGWPASQAGRLAGLGLPVDVPAGVDGNRLLETMWLDKKRERGAHHTFVLPRDGGGVDVVEDVADAEVLAATSPGL